jgi:hypothetical protein
MTQSRVVNGRERATQRASSRDQRQLLLQIRLPPVALLTDRVLALKALTDAPDVERARTA